MAEKPNWMDYANLGVQVLQTVQLDGIGTNLKVLADQAAEERAITKREADLRELIFQGEKMLEQLETLEFKKVAHVLANQWAGIFKRSNLTTASFRQYEDKERVESVSARLRAIIVQCRSELSPEALDEVEECTAYLEDPDYGFRKSGFADTLNGPNTEPIQSSHGSTVAGWAFFIAVLLALVLSVFRYSTQNVTMWEVPKSYANFQLGMLLAIGTSLAVVLVCIPSMLEDEAAKKRAAELRKARVEAERLRLREKGKEFVARILRGE